MRVFITGSESFVGKELVSQCLKKNISVCGIDLVDSASQNYDYKKMDIRAIKLSETIPPDVDAVIHLAAVSRESDCKKDLKNCYDINVLGTLNVIDASIAKNAHQIIFASTEWVYGESEELKTEESPYRSDNDSPYALSKIVGEALLKQRHEEHGIDVTILRFGIIYGSRKTNWAAVESLFNTAATKNTVEVGSLKTGRNFIHVSDIASGIIASLHLTGFNIINLAGSQFVTLGDILKESSKILGRNPRVVDQGKAPVIRSVSSQKAMELLNWKPQYDLRKGLENIMEILTRQI